MAESQGWTLWSWISRKGTSVDETPEEYLQLTAKCMRQARTMTTLLEFNHGQSKYLVDKLEAAVQSVRPLLEPCRRFDPAGLAHYMQVFKFLFSLGTEVESFIQICCNSAWVQAAVSMTNVSEHVSFIGFNLEVFKVIFFKSTKHNWGRIVTSTKVSDISKAEVETVKIKASLDEVELLKKVEDLLGSSRLSKQGKNNDLQLAEFLLERLRQSSASNLPQDESSVFDLGRKYSTQLEQQQQLGKGSFATVHAGKWLGVTVAKKTFEGPKSSDFKKELSNFKCLSHPNLIRLFGYEIRQRDCSIVMELMDGNLCQLFQERQDRGSPFTILEAIDIMHQVGEGVLYLHEHKIVHRDLKPENILFKRVKVGKTKAGYMHVKVADLGVSKMNERSRTSSTQTLNVGTSRWMAPEMIPDMMSSPPNSMKYPFQSDVYSFAMISYEIISGQLPFSSIDSPNELKKLVLAGRRPPEFEDSESPFDQCPVRLKTLVEKCWNQDPDARPRFRDICDELRFDRLPGKLRVISISSTAKAGPVVEVTAVARNSKTEIGRGEFGSVYYEDLPDRQEVPVRVVEGSHTGEKEFLDNKGHLLFKGVKMDMGAALEIIRDVSIQADNVCVNKNECKRLAERFCGLGKALEALMNEHNGDTFIETSAMGQILAVLKRGEVLVRDNADESLPLQRVVLFNEVHEEIDALGTFLDIDQIKMEKFLNFDAEIDQEEMLPEDTRIGIQSMVENMEMKRDNAGKERQANEPKRIKSDLKLNQPVTISGQSKDAGPSDPFREPTLEPLESEWNPKLHKIFVSHSGVQKAFTEKLCEKLEAVQHFPLFDIRDDSLRKGEKLFSPLVKAAKECRVAVLVLSDEFFTKSKWPMMELNEFVKVQESESNRSKPDHERLRILPLFFKITRDEFYEKRKGKDWKTVWKALKEKDDSIDLGEWKHAVSKIQGNTGIEYAGQNEGESAFIKRAVKAVCKLVRPELEWDVSHVQSKDELCEPILEQLRDVEPVDKFKAGVVGLYGMGGVGKTTISRAVCNEMYGEFGGKVCHVELGSKDPLESLRTVLRKLTVASPAILTSEHGQLVRALKERMKWQKVFLVLDNVGDDPIQIEEVQMYLGARYHDGSMVLVTSRSRDVLVQRLHIPECDCMEMPNLEEKGATNLFLQHTGRSGESFKASDEWTVIQSCVEECRFIKQERADPPKRSGQSYHYHPLALKALGSQLGTMSCEIRGWKESLKKLKINKFNMLEDNVHPLHSVLRLGYDELQEEQQHIFLDLALILVSKSKSYGLRCDWRWLCIIYGKTEAEMKESIKALRRKGFVEGDVIEVDEELDIKIHALYLEFAETEARAGPFENRRFLLDNKGTDGPRELLKHPLNVLWPSLKRVILHKSRARSLENLHHFKNVEVLDLFSCEELEEVDVRGMDNLRCVVVTGCSRLGKWIGLGKLCNLVILECLDTRIVPELILELSSLTALQILKLKSDDWSEVHLFLPDLSRCKILRELVLSGLHEMQGFKHRRTLESALVNFGKCLPVSVTKLDLAYCPKFLGGSPITTMRSLINLQDLNLKGCNEIEDLTGLYELVSLQKLNVSESGISNLDDLRKLKHLQFLDVSGCRRLTSLSGIAFATALWRLDACGCDSLRELAVEDFINLKQLEFLDVSYCTSLTSFSGIVHATKLRHLDVRGCDSFKNLAWEDFLKLRQLINDGLVILRH